VLEVLLIVGVKRAADTTSLIQCSLYTHALYIDAPKTRYSSIQISLVGYNGLRLDHFLDVTRSFLMGGKVRRVSETFSAGFAPRATSFR
jgi:hypothetical protein